MRVRRHENERGRHVSWRAHLRSDPVEAFGPCALLELCAKIDHEKKSTHKNASSNRRVADPVMPLHMALKELRTALA